MQINGEELAAYPKEFTVTALDIDNGESTARTADGTLSRDRIAVKRQIDMSWGKLTWAEISGILQAMAGVFFDFYYPDPMDGIYTTRTFYVGNRTAPALLVQNDEIYWTGLKFTLTEQ
jgi:hypothetical protein